MKSLVRRPILVLILLVGLLLPQPAQALQQEEILIIANRNVAASLRLARYYARRRQIPAANLLFLETSAEETISRQEYDRDIRRPVRKFLRAFKGERPLRCLLTIYGIPLKIRERPSSRPPASGNGKRRAPSPPKTVTRAAVDSELALVLIDDYPLAGWVVNPWFPGAGPQTLSRFPKKRVLMVCRLDGPDPETVERMIDDSLATEKKGLEGLAYFDARWPEPPPRKKLSGYKLYDAALHHAAGLVRKSHRMPVVINDEEKLFQPGECPEAALYCGWYSLARYIDAFTWKKGAVAWHIASSECASLHHANRPLWCASLLKDGVAATLGPVYEPYVQGFPRPDLFFGYLVFEYLTLAESYRLSLPFLSWQMVLIGDPLYTPFPF